MVGELRRKNLERESPERQLKQLVMEVTSVSQRPQGELVIEIANGQVWVQTEKKAGTFIKPGEQVTITAGALGSFFLSTQSGRTTRVRRVR
jgi:hypothetical protein